MSRATPLLLLALAVAACAGSEPASIHSRNPAKQVEALNAIQDDMALADAMARASRLSSAVFTAQLSRIKDPRALALVARRATDLSRQVAACERITDEGVLADLALTDPASQCIDHAFKTITDPEVLARITTEGQDNYAVSSAVEFIRDEAVLERLIAEHKGKDNLIAYRAKKTLEKVRFERMQARIAATDDPAALSAIVKTSKDRLHAKAALARIHDPAVLRDLVLDHDVPESRRLAAIERLNDPRRLSEIIAGNVTEEIKLAALARVTDPDWLFHVARESIDTPTRYPDMAGMRVLEAKRRAVIRAAAAARIDNQDHLRTIARQDPHWIARVAALNRLTDPAVLAQAATKGKNPWERIIATARLDDQALLHRLVDSRGHRAVVAALRLAMLEAASAGPVGRIDLDRKDTQQSYGRAGGGGGMNVTGETITVALVDAGGHRHQAVFATDFPKTITPVGKPKWQGERYVAWRDQHFDAHMDVATLVAPLADHLRDTVGSAERDALARSARSALLRAAAVTVATDRAAIQAALGHGDVLVRRAAAARVTDQGLLARAARDDADPLVRARAVAGLSDRSLLARIAQADKDRAVKAAARKRLDDLDLVK